MGIEHKCSNIALTLLLKGRNSLGSRNTSDDNIPLLFEAEDERKRQWCISSEDDCQTIDEHGGQREDEERDAYQQPASSPCSLS